jgi:hypothetical protein
MLINKFTISHTRRGAHKNEAPAEAARGEESGKQEQTARHPSSRRRRKTFISEIINWKQFFSLLGSASPFSLAQKSDAGR